MRTGSKAPAAAIVLLLAAFAAGVAWLFVLRFDAGDIFPVYSSLRADPLGTKAFFDGLGNLDGLSVERNFRKLPAAAEGPATVFYLGAHAEAVHHVGEDHARDLEAVAAGGGRLVVSFYPVRPAPVATETKKAKPGAGPGHETETSGAGEKGGRGRPANDNTGGSAPRTVCLLERWGFGLARAPLAGDAGPAGAPAAWRSTLVFDGLDEAWRVRQARDGRPVVIERNFGAGTIVLAADTYFLSNEAMANGRDPGLLAWIVGAHRRIVFDESHLGVSRQPGIAGLARKYRLYGLIPGLALLAGLFVWRNASSFPPPRRAAGETEGPSHAAGRDAGEAFVNLLRRNIPPREILHACLDEWARSFPHVRADGGEKLSRARAAAAASRDPVAGYRQIARILKGERP